MGFGSVCSDNCEDLTAWNVVCCVSALGMHELVKFCFLVAESVCGKSGGIYM